MTTIYDPDHRIETQGGPAVTERDDQARPIRLEGDGLDHRVIDRRSDGDATVSDEAGTTSVQLDGERTTIIRENGSKRFVLERSLAGRTTERWLIPGTAEPVDIRRDERGIAEVSLGHETIARRVELREATVLRWGGGQYAGEDAQGPVVGNANSHRRWPAETDDEGTLTVGARQYRFDHAGRLAAVETTTVSARADTGLRYRYGGNDLVCVDAVDGRVDLTAGRLGRIRSRRVGPELETYSYDVAGRRDRERRSSGERALRWDAIGRLLGVEDNGENNGSPSAVRYVHDGFGRRVIRQDRTSIVLEHRDLQGRLWSVTTVDGKPITTWLWDGHRCIASWDGHVGDRPAAVHATLPSGTVVGTATETQVADSPWGPFGEALGPPRPGDHLIPAVHFHFADPATGYVHMVQREYDPNTWSFLALDPNRGDGDDLRRLLLEVDGPLSVDPSTDAPGYALCGHDPIRRIDANGAVSAGTVIWQIFGGLTWHLPAHIINFLWIHPFVNFNFATILAWIPALGGHRGGFESWYEFWLPDSYSHEESARQDIAGFLMGGWMSANRTFTFQNAIWGRKRRWDQLATVGSFEPTDRYEQLRHGSIQRIHRADGTTAATFDDWTLLFQGFDGTSFGGARQFSFGGGEDSESIIGRGRDRLLTAGNLHLFRDVDDFDAAGNRTSLISDDLGNPGHGLVEFHERATAVTELAPGATCSTVTIRTAGRLFTHPSPVPSTADGDVIRLAAALCIIDGVGARNGDAELSVRVASTAETMPPPGTHPAVWSTADVISETLSAAAGGLAVTTTAVSWSVGDLARFGGPGSPTVPVTAMTAQVPIRAQDALGAGLQVRPLTNPQLIPGATIVSDQIQLPASGTAVTTGMFLRLTDGTTVRIGRVVAVTPTTTNRVVTLHQTASALGLPASGSVTCELLTVAAARGTLVTAVPVGTGNATINIPTNTAMATTAAGFAVGGNNAIAVITGPEARTVGVNTALAVGAGPWNVTRLSFAPNAARRTGELSPNVEMVSITGGDPVSSLAPDAALRLRSVNPPATAPVAVSRDSDTTFTQPTGTNIGAGDLVQIAGTTTAVVSVEDVLLTVTLDRPVGTPGEIVGRVCATQPGETVYDATLDAASNLRLDGTTGAGTAGGLTAALMPTWPAGTAITISDGAASEEWVLDTDYSGGSLSLISGPGPIGATLAPGPWTVQRLAPTWPPIALETTRVGAGSSSVNTSGTDHRWIVSVPSTLATTPTTAPPPVLIQIGDEVSVARVIGTGPLTVRCSQLPTGTLTAAPVATAGATDRVETRWRQVGDEIQLFEQRAPTPATGPTLILDSLAPVQSVPVRPRQQAVACPAEPENPDWIFTAYEALREHELHHTIQSSKWGPLMLGLPLSIVGDILWDIRGGSGSIEASAWVDVEPMVGDGPPNRQTQSLITSAAAPADFTPEPGTVVELEGNDTAWRSVSVALETIDGRTRFMLSNPPEEDFGDGSLRARIVSHTTPEADGWLTTFRILDTFSNAQIMEFTTGLIWEGLIHLFWLIGRGFASLGTDRVTVERVSPTSGTEVRALDSEALAELNLESGSRVIVDTEQGGNDDYPTLITSIDGDVITLRDPLPNYDPGATIRLGAYQPTDPDRWVDVWSYTLARLVPLTRNVIQLQGDDPPTLSVMDLVKVKWVNIDGESDDADLRVTLVVDADEHTYQLEHPIDERVHDPDTLQVAKLGSVDDPNDFPSDGVAWFLNRSYETPIRINRVTRYLFDPWRSLTSDTDFVQPADGSTWKKVVAWMTRGVRYAVSNRSWTPLFGKVWWTSIFGQDHASDLEQQASWASGDLYTVITRSGDPRFAPSEGSFGNEPGTYPIFEGELLRMWTWEPQRWNSVFNVPFGTAALSPQDPSLRSGAVDVTPWTMSLAVTPPAGLTGPGLPVELYNGTAPRPFLTIPTRSDIGRNQGFYFVAAEAGTYVISTTAPTFSLGATVSREVEAAAAGVQNANRSVAVQPLDVRAGTTVLPWQAAGAPAALTLFPTQAVDITVAGTGGTYEVQAADETLLDVPDERRLQARLTSGNTVIEVARIHRADDPYLTQFGSYIADYLRVPVRRCNVTIDGTIVVRSGPLPGDAPVTAPVRPGDTLSVLLPVTADGLPVAAWAGTPVGSPALPVVSGPATAGSLQRYDTALSVESPESTGDLDITFTFTDPVDPTVSATTSATVTVEPRATLEGPPFLVNIGGPPLSLTVTPNDGTTVDPATLVIDPPDASPAPGISVAVNGGAIEISAVVGAAAGSTFVVRVLWDGTVVRRSVVVAP